MALLEFTTYSIEEAKIIFPEKQKLYNIVNYNKYYEEFLLLGQYDIEDIYDNLDNLAISDLDLSIEADLAKYSIIAHKIQLEDNITFPSYY